MQQPFRMTTEVASEHNDGVIIAVMRLLALPQ